MLQFIKVHRYVIAYHQSTTWGEIAHSYYICIWPRRACTHGIYTIQELDHLKHVCILDLYSAAFPGTFLRRRNELPSSSLIKWSADWRGSESCNCISSAPPYATRMYNILDASSNQSVSKIVLIIVIIIFFRGTWTWIM